MIAAGQLAYFAETKASLKPIGPAHHFKKKKDRIALLWGDQVYVISIDQGVATVSAKGHHLSLPVDHLMEDALLSIYQIDCGQGDAALIHFPDDRWMMIDGGPPHDWSNTGKIAADFLYWKMFVDQSWKNEFAFRLGPFHLDALVCSHPDYDHYGGFMDMTRRVDQANPTLTYGTVFHNGMGRFSGVSATKYQNGAGFGQLGPVAGNALPDAFLTTLIDDESDIQRLSRASGRRRWKLAGNYGGWLEELAGLVGQGVKKIQRVDSSMKHLPRFGPSQRRDYAIRVLGPIIERWRGKPALRYLDTAGVKSMAGPSLTRNGHSIVLRIDYHKVRILMTGDLNFKSQALMLDHIAPQELACHVAKACHHGSDDISSTFLGHMSPLVTMFSSGDNESYAHPRAKVLGLAGMLGTHRTKGKHRYRGFSEPRTVAPLIYSTELSRSVELFDPAAVYDAAGVVVPKPVLEARPRTATGTGRRGGLGHWLLGDRMVYGLINLRTDGERIVMGVLKESVSSFQVEELTI